MKPVRLHRKAHAESKHIAAHCSGLKPGLGLRFVDDVDRTLMFLRSNPEAFPKVFRNARRTTPRKLPYNLVYLVKETHVLVLAVAHHRQRTNLDQTG
ncbi:MAG: type II toxin-antitoxin system RelE/ParE family toxin [Candidatus Hydrogenedentes bacterium]|nr:type II toxin-antitoxin system RelE/ParE family toxin [Candidatus Hydrogenedentota bacterium]